MSAPIKPFKIAVPDKALANLREKLAAATFPHAVDFSDDKAYGAPLKDIKRLAAYWEDGFDWRAQEAKLNEVPQFTTTVGVDGFEELEIHFVHQKSSKAGSIPLLFCHGCKLHRPGSFLEVTKILPLLTEPADGSAPTFHVVAPSLPNFGFSQAVSKKGFSIPQYAEVCHKLMQQLGYTQYVTQGGDWGFLITRFMGVRYPANCLASHVNFVRTVKPPSLSKHPLLYLQSLFGYSNIEKAGLARMKWFETKGSGYWQLQSTRPSTLGFALADSPVALLAWVFEKLHDWTDSYPWTDDEVLAWISIYQFSVAGPAASVRIYYESTQASLEGTARALEYNANVPLGLSYFPRDVIVPPSLWGQTLGPVVFEARHESGGHFAAYEAPDVLVGDLRKMFGGGGGAEKVAKKLTAKL